MSHFVVFVIGPNVSKQLAPYHEFECTDLNDQYVQDIDETEEVRAEYQAEADEHASFLDWCNDNDKHVVREGETPDREGEHKYGYVVVSAAGELVKAVNRTNPNYQWDWWVVGGRWNGFLKLKPGVERLKDESHYDLDEDKTRANVAFKGDIDFEHMKQVAADRATAAWEKAHAAALTTGGLWQSFEQVLAQVQGVPDQEPEQVERARNAYARNAYLEQPAVVAIRQAFNDPFIEIDRFLMPRDRYIRIEAAQAICPYAFVKDGTWCEKGTMGWFGISHDEMPEGDWIVQATEMLMTLPDDTRITVVDCHI